MNIAMLSPSQNAYSETFIQEQKNKLAGKIFYYYGSRQDQRLEGYERLAKKSYSTFFLRARRKLFHKSFSWYYDELLKMSFQRQKIDVVLAQYGDTANLYLSAIKELNLPLVVHFHGYDASIKEVIERNNNYKEVFAYASYVIAVSNKMYSDLINYGCSPTKLIYNVYGPNEKFYSVESQFSKDQFVAVGRFVDKKAPYYLILSFSEVVKEYPQACLVVAGDGFLWNTCRNLVKALGLEKNVVLPGVVSPEVYRQYLSESLAFVQHSVIAENGDSEGTPVALLEASAAGLPVIATRHAGIADVILDQETGLLVEEHDYKKMADLMKKLLRDKEYARKLGAKGKVRMKKEFTLQRHIETLDNVLQRALS